MKRGILLFAIAMMAIPAWSQNQLKYNFEGTLAETNLAGPVLSVLGTEGTYVLDTLNEIQGKTKTVYRFEKNCGFQFQNTQASGFLGETYTIELYFVFDELSSWKRVVDWKNRKTDKGAYVFNGQINFYNIIYSPTAPVVAGEYTYYVVTRDGASKKVNIYTDAQNMVEFTDSWDDAVLDGDQVLNFFHDDLMVANEASPGAVALLNLYNYALDTTTIRQNWLNINGQVFGIGEGARTSGSLSVTPNPAAGQARVDLSGFEPSTTVSVSLATLSGSVVRTWSVVPGPQKEMKMNLAGLPAGIYIVSAVADDRTLTGKLVVAGE